MPLLYPDSQVTLNYLRFNFSRNATQLVQRGTRRAVKRADERRGIGVEDTDEWSVAWLSVCGVGGTGNRGEEEPPDRPSVLENFSSSAALKPTRSGTAQAQPRRHRRLQEVSTNSGRQRLQEVVSSAALRGFLWGQSSAKTTCDNTREPFRLQVHDSITVVWSMKACIYQGLVTTIELMESCLCSEDTRRAS